MKSRMQGSTKTEANIGCESDSAILKSMPKVLNLGLRSIACNLLVHVKVPQ